MALAKIHTSSTLENLRDVAIAAYLRSGGRPQAAWLAVRERLPLARAPQWDEKIGKNSGRCRSYICPLGAALGIRGAMLEFGDHCANWPRTQRSYRAAAEVAQTVRDWLESQACAVV